jgi:hypothetical protein
MLPPTLPAHTVPVLQEHICTAAGARHEAALQLLAGTNRCAVWLKYGIVLVVVQIVPILVTATVTLMHDVFQQV